VFRWRSGALQPGGLVYRAVAELTVGGAGFVVVTSWHRRAGQVGIRDQSWVRCTPAD
jgi:hypothetical protein